jgi:glycerophosphoryl diester phosphodiesterase
MTTSDTWPYPLWVAHRGAGKLAPENTLAAFKEGARHGYRAFECDVKLSADGVPFLMHDATLQRTTSGQGPSAERSWEQLSQLDAGSWHGPAFANERLPRLDAVARYCLDNGFALNIEIKPSPGHEAKTGREVAAEAAALWHGQAVQPLMSSFNVEALASAQQAAPHLPRALLLDKLPPGWLQQARDLGCAAIVCNHKLLDAGVIASIHGQGMRSLAYTVNDAVDVRRLLDAGIDGLITDAVDRFSPDAPRSSFGT